MTVAGGRAGPREGSLARRTAAAWYVGAAVLAITVSAGPATAQGPVVEEVIVVPSGSYFEEALFVAGPTSRWEGEFESVSGHPIDVYIIRTTDLLGAYPDGNFAPLVETENTTFTAFDFIPPDRSVSYTLVIDNMDNGHPFDADAGFTVTVRMARSAPLRSNPEAQALLGSLAGVCAGILLVGAVAVALYLRYRRPSAHEDERSLPPRVEIDVAVPRRPRGAWAAPEGGHDPVPGAAGGAEAGPPEGPA